MRMVKIVFMVGLLGLSSCTTIRGWRSGDGGAGAADQPAATALDTSASAEEIRSELVSQVQQYITTEEGEGGQNRVIRKRPYYFKAYNQYPKPASEARIEITETESRTSPLIADVELDRIRFATRYHRSRDAARSDNTFLRDTGTETLTYEFRNGRWIRMGSFFLAETTEEEVNGSWVPVQRGLQRTLDPEDPEQGWFARTWSSIFGRN